MTPLRISRRPAAFACLALTLLSACGDTADRLLSVTTPSRLGAGNYLVPQNAALITASAVADFECAFGAYVVSSGLTAGELADASQTASRWSLDRRDFLPTDAYGTAACDGTNLGTYTPLSTARFTADQAYTAISGWTDAQVSNRPRLLGTAALYAGYSLVVLGEGYCSAALSGGAELTSAQLLDSAQARFTTAIAAAQLVPASDTLRATILNAAYVGRARARLDRGDKPGAAADAALVPATFVLNATAGTAGRRNNRVYAENNQNNSGVTVAAPYRALTVQGAPDPRVRVTDANATAGDQVNRIFRQTKYAALDASIPIATGREAQLILAEAQGAGTGVATLNALRSRAGVALPPLTAAEAADFQGTVLEERRRELFLQGNRLYDLRRANLTPTPAPGTPYPKGGTYGAQLCYPLPDAERAANPNTRTG